MKRPVVVRTSELIGAERSAHAMMLRKAARDARRRIVERARADIAAALAPLSEAEAAIYRRSALAALTAVPEAPVSLKATMLQIEIQRIFEGAE